MLDGLRGDSADGSFGFKVFVANDAVCRGFEIRSDPTVFPCVESCRQENRANDFRHFANLVSDGVRKLAFPFEMEKGATAECNGGGHKQGNLTYQRNDALRIAFLQADML